jgi:hypothetical protein
VNKLHQLGPGCSAAKPAAASSQRRQANKNIDSAKVNRMVNSATRYIKVIEAQAVHAANAPNAPKTQRTLSRAFAGPKQNSYFLY